MHTVDIKIFCIAQTRINPEATREWLDHIGAKETPVPRVKAICEMHHPEYCECPYSLEPEVTDAGAVCGLCAKRCYMSFEPGLNPNVTRVRKVWHEYLANILKSGHGSVTEHATWTFAIEGVSRVFTAEMNRHRVGVAISEGSMRYIRFDDIGFWMPISLAPGNQLLRAKCATCKGKKTKHRDPRKKCGQCKHKRSGCQEHDSQEWLEEWEPKLKEDCERCFGIGFEHGESVFEDLKGQTRALFKIGFIQMETNYKDLCDLWGIEKMKSFDTKKKLTSLFRRLIGMGAASGGTWTFNTRALRHIVAMRTSPHAEEEIAMAIGMIGKWIVESETALFGDFERDEATGAWIPEHAKI